MFCVAKGQKSMINKNHPYYELYLKEVNDLRDGWVTEENKAREKYKDFRGKDRPYGHIGKKYLKKLKKIKEKYSYLFTD